MKIGIDIDNVIADTHPSYLVKFKERFGDKLSQKGADFYHIEQHIDADPKEVWEYLDRELHSDEFQITINPILDAPKYIQSWAKEGNKIYSAVGSCSFYRLRNL